MTDKSLDRIASIIGNSYKGTSEYCGLWSYHGEKFKNARLHNTSFKFVVR